MSVKTTHVAVKMAVEAQKSISEAFDMMEEFFGVRPDSKFFNVYWEGMEKLISAVSIAVGDEQDWLSWYIYDNEHGEKGMKAGYDGKLKKIGSIRALVRLIEEGKRR